MYNLPLMLVVINQRRVVKTSASGANWITLTRVYVTTAMFAGLGNGMTYKARIKAVRESDNVESFSELWPCVYIVEANYDTGA